MTPVGWQDIRAWQELCGGEVSKVEAQLMFAASKHFVGQYNASRDDKEPAPYIDKSLLPPGAVSGR